MSWGVKSLRVLIVLAILPFAFFACNKKAQHGMCKSNDDCRVDASGKVINGICHMGKCEECLEDGDCKDSRQCINNRCEKSCQADADCGASMHCQNNFCVDNCVADSDCLGDRVCAQGRCVAGIEGKDGYAMMGDDCQSFELVHFDFDRYNIKAEYTNHVEKLARCLENHPNYHVTIGGHADDRGTTSYNFALGERRAKAVADYLTDVKGIAKERVQTVSYGETMPLLSEKNDHAWQQNRRAAFDVKAH